VLWSIIRDRYQHLKRKPAAIIFEIQNLVADYSEISVTTYQSLQNITSLPNFRSHYYYLKHNRRHLILLCADDVVAGYFLW
jgi:hypothetical protein